MLSFEYFKILCNCGNEITLTDSDFQPLEKSHPLSIEPEFKIAPIKCPNCDRNGAIKICWKKAIYFPERANDILYRDDVHIDNNFHITECKINILENSPSWPTNQSTQAFINDSLTRIYNEFFLESQQKNFYSVNKCILNFTFEQDSINEIDYSRKDVQQLYLLYYFYAYFLQYKHLYSQIELDSYNIFSIGCGNLIDYYGFRYAKSNDVSYCYYGIDQCNWCYRDLIPDNSSKIFSCNQSLSDCMKNFKSKGLNKSLGLFNVFIFPKSIEYLENEEKDIHELSLLAEAIRETDFKHDKIYLVLNGMKEDIKKDEEKLDLIIAAFADNGFKLKEPITRYDGDKCGLNVVCGDRSLQYPKSIQDMLKIICNPCINKTFCSIQGTLKGDPMLSAEYFKYRIAELVKEGT